MQRDNDIVLLAEDSVQICPENAGICRSDIIGAFFVNFLFFEENAF